MSKTSSGRLLSGDRNLLKASHEAFSSQPVDLDLTLAQPPAPERYQTTIAGKVSVRGGGTFSNKTITTLDFEPSEKPGWWFDRIDMPDCLPTRASVRNVWTTGYLVSNIVLHSGDPHNYCRMVEHIIALKQGLGIDNVTVRIDSGDPPLFDRGSIDLIEALDRAGVQPTTTPVRYLTVKEPVVMTSPSGAFLAIEPAAPDRVCLDLDCAVDFPNFMGKQRLQLTLTPELFRRGAVARTNTSATKKLFCQTLGKVFADVRNLGYTSQNILVAGRKRFLNEPRLMEGGKSLEAVWHRAALDLLAALNLVEEGRFVGRVTSYKAGHRLDVQMITRLYLDDLLEEIVPA
jgi:UDP-3-O-acyl-N-acetylglucosamine deacetylase